VTDVDGRRWAQLAVLVDPTRRAVYDVVERAGPCSRDQLAFELGLSRSLVGHHLSRLEGEGLVTAVPGSSSGGVGRPPVLYALAARPGLPDRRYELLAALLAEAAPRPARMAAAARRQGAATVPAAGTARARAKAAFLELGFRPVLSRGVLRATSCPFLEVSALRPEVACAVAHSLADGVAGELPGARAEPVRGARCCVQLRFAAG
jgi:predicted ArsR family transcriptional regulator